MATTAQFNFIDGGERNPNNISYYINFLGINSSSFISYQSSMPFFTVQHGSNPATGWTIPNFSSATIYYGNRLFLYGQNSIYFINSSGQTILIFNINLDGSATIQNSTSTLFTTNTNIFPQSTIFYFEIYINANSGIIDVHLNGNASSIPGFPLTGQNISNSLSNLEITNIIYTANQISSLISFRDAYAHDGTGNAPFNGLLGDVSCVQLTPNADISAQFTPVGHTLNYQNIATTSPSASDYNTGITAGISDTYSIATLPTNVAQILGVKLYDYSYKSDSGARTLAKTITSGTTTVTGTINYLNGSPVVTEDLYVTDPNTNSAFTLTSADNLVIGYKIIN